MSNSAIKEIYSGNGSISDRIEQSKEYWDLIERVSSLSLKLEENMTDAQKELYREIDSLDAGLESESAFTHFATGFKLGFRLALEIGK